MQAGIAPSAALPQEKPKVVTDAHGRMDVLHHTHAHCWACGRNPRGLNLRFVAQGNSVEARFDCDSRYAGYGGMLHGGIVASILDSAMTNCLFHCGVVALTVELTVRYRHPVQCNRVAVVRAWVRENRGALWIVRAELRQEEQLKARAAAKFLRSA